MNLWYSPTKDRLIVVSIDPWTKNLTRFQKIIREALKAFDYEYIGKCD